MGKMIFEEKQYFRQWWVWLIVILGFAANSYAFIQNESSAETFTITSIVFLLFVLLIFNVHLSSRIDEKGIHIKFFPLHFSFITYTWDQIKSVEFKKYSPILDYGGWGVRISLNGKGKAFNVSGSKGIYIQTQDDRKRMIGTQKENEVKAVLEEYKRKNPSNL